MKNIAITPPEWFSKNTVYQINPRTFSKEGTISAITKELPFIKSLGFNIVYLCPIFEMDDNEDISGHSPRQLKSGTGNPKNMYRMNDYFKIDVEYGSMSDLEEMIRVAHKLDMKVILDLVYMHIGPNADIISKHPEFVKQNADGSFICTAYRFPALDFSNDGLREYLYCNMMYYIAVLDADGYRCDVGDYVPLDFWKEAKRRMSLFKSDVILINEGDQYEKMTTVFDSSYCWEWHDLLRKVYCENQSANALCDFQKELDSKTPLGAKLLCDMDNHDTVTDWEGRTETVAGHDGMEQILALNYIIDGIPMVYAGNEISCCAKLNMFSNRFYRGVFEYTDRNEKNTDTSLRRQFAIKVLNKLKSESDILCNGETAWIDTKYCDSIVAFKRVLGEQKIIFVGNTKKSSVDVEIPEITKNAKCLLSNNCTVKESSLAFGACGYAVFQITTDE